MPSTDRHAANGRFVLSHSDLHRRVGKATGAPRPLPVFAACRPCGRLCSDLVFDVSYDHFNGEQLADLLHIRILRELINVGVRHTPTQLR